MTAISRRRFRILLFGTVVALAVPAAAPAEEGEVTWRTIFRGSTQVNVVNVDVYVTDPEGRPVTGLTRDDFRLLENGRPVEISNFFATEGGRLRPPPASAATAAQSGEAALTEQPHHLILLVDRVNIAEANRARIFARLREFLLDQWRPALRVMVASNGRKLSLHGGFAESPHDVFAALEQLQATGEMGPSFDIERRQLLRDIGDLNVEAASGFLGTSGGSRDDFQAEVSQNVVAQAATLLSRIRGLSEQQMVHVRQTLGVIAEFVSLACGLPGRKSVVYVSDGLPLRPGEPLFEAFARRLEPLAAQVDVSPELEADRYDLTQVLEELLTRANSGGVTFYALYSDRPAPLVRGSAETAAGSGGSFGTWDLGVESGLERNAQDSLVLMARETGGRYSLAEPGAADVLLGMLADGDNYYSLGYVAEPLADDSLRQVRVELSEPHWQVRFRRRFRDLSIAERTAEKTRAALISTPDDNPLEMTLAADAPRPEEDGTFVVPLKVSVPLGRLVLLPGAAEHRAHVSIFVMARDPEGRVSEMTRHLCPIRIGNAEILTARGRKAACGVSLRMRGGPQRVAVSMLDEAAAADSTLAVDLEVGGEPQPLG